MRFVAAQTKHDCDTHPSVAMGAHMSLALNCKGGAGGAGARLARRRRLLSSPDAQQVALPRNYLSSSHGARCDAATNEQQAVRGGGGGGVRETETPPPPLDFGNQSFSH